MRLLLISLLAISVTNAGEAEPARDPVATDFYFARSELAHEPGAAAVLDRIVAEVSEVCREQRPDSRLRGPIDPDCVNEMVASAVTQINVPKLTTVYRQWSGQREQFAALD